MKLVYFVSAFLMLCEGKAATTTKATTTTRHTTATTTTATTATTATTTTTAVTTQSATTASPGVNLSGKMVTLSRYSEVTFYRPNDPKVLLMAPTTATLSPKTTMTTTTAMPTTIDTPPPPATRGVSVCLRFLADNSFVPLFRLSLDSSEELSFSLDNKWYHLSWGYDSVNLNPMIKIWSPVRTQWTSVCMILDSLRNIVQAFQGGSMSLRKIPPFRMVWSGEPVLRVSGFDGQVKDLEVWDYPLEETEIYSFMQNYGSGGTVLTWSNIEYRHSGNILVEDAYAFGLRQPISSSEGAGQPIRSGKRRDRRLRNRKTLNERKQRRREML